MSETFDKYFEVNKNTWDQKVDIHTNSNFYNLEAFKKGKSSLKSYELEALGDVSEKSLLHLQCHFGQDTLSWSRMGAKCTGVDISEKGITMAKALNTELHCDARFVCCNVLDTSNHIKEEFDIVFTSYGVIGWLPNLESWGKMIAQRLKKGGTFYMVEFHPIAWMFDYLETKPILKYGYDQDEVIYEEYKGTYADEKSIMISKEYCWNHGLGKVVSALSLAGLTVNYLKEHDQSPYKIFPDLIEKESGMYEMEHKLYPLLFSILATKS